MYPGLIEGERDGALVVPSADKRGVLPRFSPSCGGKDLHPACLICIDDDVKLHGGRKGDGMRCGLARAMPICVSRGPLR